MGMAVRECAMPVLMGVGFAYGVVGAVAVLVVGIMCMLVFMLHAVMRVVMVVPLGQV